MNSQTLHQSNSSNRSAMLHRQPGSASAAAAEKLVDENAILLLADQDQLVAVHCNGNGKSSSIERARAKRSSKV